jgi:hypothetical protein
MALNYGVGGGDKGFDPVPAGTHFGVCTLVADVGLQPGSGIYPQPKRTLYLRFEIPAERVEWEKDGTKHEGPAVIYEKFTASMNKKANLRLSLEAWYGTSFTDEQAAKVDISKVLGRPATLSVVHNKSGDKTYANVASIGPLPKGMPAVKPENDLVLFENNGRGFDKLPKFLQKKVEEQVEAERKTETDVDEERAAEHAGDFDDDLPF